MTRTTMSAARGLAAIALAGAAALAGLGLALRGASAPEGRSEPT